jgi:hypothetical protein
MLPFFSLHLCIHPTTKQVFALPISLQPPFFFFGQPASHVGHQLRRVHHSRTLSIEGHLFCTVWVSFFMSVMPIPQKGALPVGRNILPIQSSGSTVDPYPYLDAQYATEAHHYSTNRRLIHC